MLKTKRPILAKNEKTDFSRPFAFFFIINYTLLDTQSIPPLIYTCKARGIDMLTTFCKTIIILET